MLFKEVQLNGVDRLFTGYSNNCEIMPVRLIDIWHIYTKNTCNFSLHAQSADNRLDNM